MSERVDYDALRGELMMRADVLVPQWLPAGRRVGAEWCCGSVNGEPGSSFKVNLRTGAWSDFAHDTEKGGDLISLYAAIHRIKQGEAARELLDRIGSNVRTPARGAAVSGTAARVADGRFTATAVVPLDAPAPSTSHSRLGTPERVWRYLRNGQLLGLVCRYRAGNGGKEILPLTWCVKESQHGREARWHFRAWESPRPLYLASGFLRPGVVKVIVEGEKCADALHEKVGAQFDVLSWPGGCKAVNLADWQWIAGERVVLWADADSHRRRLTEEEVRAGVDPSSVEYLPVDRQPGASAMHRVAEKLDSLGCTISFTPISEPGVKPDGWDCADAIEGIGVPEPWHAKDLEEYLAAARPLAQLATAAMGCARTPAAAEGAPEAGAVRWPHPGAFGLPKGTRENIIAALTQDPTLVGCVGLNEFTRKAEVLRSIRLGDFTVEAGNEWAEHFEGELALYLVGRFGMASPNLQIVAEAVRNVAMRNKFHPVRERFLALKWDCVDRLDRWLFQALGLKVDAMTARQVEYLAHVGRWFLMGMVRRVLQPGCKWDYMLVLEGPQGFRKSTLGKVLAGEYFSDTHLNLGDKDSYLQLQGRLLHEFSELHSLSGKDVSLVKAFLTSTTDYIRAPFDRRPAEYPRQCVFFGTSNNPKWARDRSGNRRFWPVEVIKPIDTDWVQRCLDQLLAEAVYRVNSGERCFPTHEEERAWFIPEQSARVRVSATEEALMQFLCGQRDSHGQRQAAVGCPDRVTLTECLDGIGIDLARSHTAGAVQVEVQELLKRWGWAHKRSGTFVAGVRPWYYVRPEVWPPRDEQASPGAKHFDGETPQAQAGNLESDDAPF